MKTKVSIRAMALVTILGLITFTFFVVPDKIQASPDVTLRFSLYYPDTHPHTMIIKRTLPWVEKVTNGEVKIKLFPSSTLVKYTEILNGIQSGAADMSIVALVAFGSTFPLFDVDLVPFLIKSNAHVTWSYNFPGGLCEIFEEELASHGLNKIHIFRAFNIGMRYLTTTKKQVKVPSNLRGLKLRTTGTLEGALLKKFGGASVVLPVAESYEAFSRGVVDGGILNASAIAAYKWHEECKYLLNVPLSNNCSMLFINKDSYAKIPEKWRNVMGLYFEHMIDTLGMEVVYEEERVMGRIFPQHMTYYTPTPQERELWVDENKWISEEWMKKAGPRGQRVIAVIKKYSEFHY